MKKKGWIGLLVLRVLVGVVWCGNLLLTGWIERSNTVCIGQYFSTVEEAMQAMEAEALREADSSSNCHPPYTVVYTFDYDKNTVVLYRYNDYFGEESADYGVRILRHHKDGTLSFTGGTADFPLQELAYDGNYYYFTNIRTAWRQKSLSLLYLSADSDRDIYVDGKKTEKVRLYVEGQQFYLCYGISNRDTFLSNLITPISNRHKIEIK